MKKLLLFVFIYACTYDLVVNYNEISGYLTDVDSAKYGLSGWWQWNEYSIRGSEHGTAYASFISEAYIIDSYDIGYNVYQENGAFIIEVKSIVRKGQYPLTERISELEKLLEEAIKKNDQNKIQNINEWIERLRYVSSLRNTYNQKPIPTLPFRAEIIQLNKSVCTINYDGEIYRALR